MAENLAIAKVQEEALTKKMNERQQRLEEQAARRFGTPTGLTDDDKEQRQIYKKVLEFEQESTKFTDLRKDLEEKPNDPELINKLIENITSTPDHPLTQKMNTQQTRILDKLQHLVADKLNILDQIKVPLSESLYPEHHFKKEMEEGTSFKEVGTSFKEEGTSSKESEGNKDNRVGDQTDNKMDEKDEEKEEGCEEGIDVKKDIHVKYEDEDSDDNGPGDSWEPGYQGETSDIVNTADKLQTDLKEDIEKAIDMGDKECEKLETNVRKAKGILHQISQEYDKYNQDNMDDLFDEDENYDEIEENSIQLNDQSDIGNKKDNSDVANSASLSDLKSIEMKIRDLKNEAYQRHIKAISEDIHMYLEKMLVLFTVCYEELDCVTGKDQCYACLEESIFKPVWRYLLALFRLANEPKELALAHVMTEKMSCDPVDCNVSAKLQLANCDTPYDTVVTHLQTLPNQQTLLSKLECLVKCSRLVCQCIEDYYSNQKIPTIGADDLLPILCFVIIKAGHPEILSECLILEEFIHEGYIMGEEGYCLTSIQTAVGYLVSQGMTT